MEQDGMSRDQYDSNVRSIRALRHSRVRGKDNRRVTHKRVGAAQREVRRMQALADKNPTSRVAANLRALVEQMENDLNEALS